MSAPYQILNAFASASTNLFVSPTNSYIDNGIAKQSGYLMMYDGESYSWNKRLSGLVYDYIFYPFINPNLKFLS